MITVPSFQTVNRYENPFQGTVMPLFSNVSFRDGVQDDRGDRFAHLRHVLAPNSRCAVAAPEMKGQGTTVVFLPYPNFSNPKYKEQADTMPDRMSDDPRDYGPWLFHAEGVVKFGVNPVTFLFDDPVDGDGGYVASEANPVHLLCDAAWRAGKANAAVVETPFGNSETDRWKLLYEGGEDPATGKTVFKAVKRPERVVMAYALVFASGKVNYLMQGGAPLGGAAGDPPVVFVMSQYTASEGLCKAIEAVVGEENNLRLKYPVVTGQKYVHFYDNQSKNCPALQAAALGHAAPLGGFRRSFSPLGGAADQKKADIGYGVLVTDTLTGRAGDPTIDHREFQKYACNTLRPWEEVVHGYSPDKAAHLIATHCRLPWSLLYHAWKAHPEYYPEEMRDRLKRLQNASAAVPAAVPPAPTAGPAAGQANAQAPAASGMFAGLFNAMNAGAPAGTVPPPPADDGGYDLTGPDSGAGSDDEPPDSADAAAFYDEAAAKAANERLRAHVAAQAARAPGSAAGQVTR